MLSAGKPDLQNSSSFISAVRQNINDNLHASSVSGYSALAKFCLPCWLHFFNIYFLISFKQSGSDFFSMILLILCFVMIVLGKMRVQIPNIIEVLAKVLFWLAKWHEIRKRRRFCAQLLNEVFIAVSLDTIDVINLKLWRVSQWLIYFMSVLVLSLIHIWRCRRWP